VEKHADELSWIGESGENAPIEANFDETTSIVQAQEPIQVTPNSGALLRLDKGVAQPRTVGAKTEKNQRIPLTGSHWLPCPEKRS